MSKDQALQFCRTFLPQNFQCKPYSVVQLASESMIAEGCFHIGTQVSRLLPWTMKNYKLDEITTLADLRKNVALLFRQNAHIRDPKVT